MHRDVDADLVHHGDGLRTNKARDRAGTDNFKSIAGQITQQTFGHLAARRVASAKKQHARFLNHGGPSVSNLQVTRSSTKWRRSHLSIVRPQKAERLLV